MANKKKVTKVESSKENKKETKLKKSEKKVLQEEKNKELIIDEKLDLDEEFEDYDDEEIELEVEDESSLEVVQEFNLNNEVKALKMLVCVSICVTIISLLISLVILNKVTSGNDNKKDNESETSVDENENYDVSMFKSIKIDEFKEMYDDDKTYFVYTGRSTCGYCVAFLPTLQQSVKEYDYTLYYLDMSNVTNDDISSVIEMDEDFSDTFSATPMVYVIGDKELVSVNEGYTDYDTYAKFLEDHGVEKK